MENTAYITAVRTVTWPEAVTDFPERVREAVKLGGQG